MKRPSHLANRLLKSKSFIILVCAVALGVGLLGIAYESERKKNVQLLNKNSHPVITSNSVTASDIERTNTASDESSTPGRNSVKSNTQIKSSTPTTTPIPKPPVTRNCSYSAIPYNHSFVKGTGPYTRGSDGTSETCTYSDGRPPDTSTLIQPRQQVNYINITTSDYDTARDICDDYPSKYFETCMQVVRQQ